MKVIFLDVDGVVINRRSLTANKGKHISVDGWDRIDSAAPECVVVLNKLIEETGAKIVLSSSWRIGRSVIECRDLMNHFGIKGQLVDRTGDYAEPRGAEIQEWLTKREAERGDVESFVILDDERDMAHLLPRLVKTSMDGGLTEEHAKLVKELFAI